MMIDCYTTFSLGVLCVFVVKSKFALLFIRLLVVGIAHPTI